MAPIREGRGDGILERQGRDGGALIAAGFGAYAAAFLAWAVAGGAPGDEKALIADLAAVPAGLLATFLVFRASRTPGIAPLAVQAWRSIGLACVSYVVGDGLWFFYEVVLRQAPSPSPASLFYLAYYPLFLFGLLRFPTVLEHPHRKIEFWLDATIVLLGGSLVVWYFVLDPAAAQGPRSLLASALHLAYPVADLVLVLAASVTIGALHKDPARPALVWLVVGLVLEFAGDLIQGANALQGTMAPGGIADAFFIAHWASYGLGALAFARAGGKAAAADADAPVINVFPYAAAVVGYGVLAVAMRGHWSTDVGRLLIGVMALTAVVLVRQVLAERANLQLLREQATRKSEARFRALVQNASDVIVVADAARRIRYHTPSLERLLGHPSAHIQGRPLDPLVHPEDLPRGLALLGDAVRQSGAIGPADWRILQADGSWRNMEVTILSLLHEPDIEGVVVTLRDVHERKSLEERLTHLAFHDSLTGLANRSLLADRLRHSLAWARREGRPVSLLFLDLDHFKAVNDGLGHAAGDQVLAEVARRLASGLRTTDTAARLGGDEFACLLEDTDEKGALQVAERLVESLRQPIRFEEREAAVSASVGIAVSRGGSESPEEMVRNADVAMYEAKQAGRNRCLVFEPGQHDAVVQRLGTEADLRRAVERSEMLLLYQPIVALGTGAVVGAEALIRWDHPRRGRLGPGDFIPLAEEREIIIPIGRFVLGEACRRARMWAGAGESTYVSVNLSGRQLQDKGFIDDVRRALAASGLPASGLILEITETFSLLETPAVVGRLFELQALGVRLAIDDFGTGYSALSYLQTLPMAVLKIDRAFVAAPGPRAAPVLRGIVELGKAMGLGLVAEGIETSEQVATLRALGCEHGQGFLFARPMEAPAIDALMADGATLPRGT